MFRLVQAGTVPPQAWVVFITNAQRQVACWSARVAPTPTAAVIWDYHVVAVDPLAAAGPQVWDLDSVLAPPCSLRTWVTATFPPGAPAELSPRLRIVPAAVYLAELRSDRSHMVGADGSWAAPPPPWPPPGADRGGGSNLDSWLDLEAGEWIGPAELLRRGYASPT